MTKILLIDTATEACSVALKHGDQLIERYQVAPRQHGELVLPMVDELLNEADLKLADLDFIGFDQGPGAFTGLRICTAIVQGLAFGADLPVIGCSSLQAMAQQAHTSHGAENVLAAIDARMGEVYWGQYQLQDGVMQLIGAEQVCAPENVTFEPLARSNYYAVGTGWQTYADSLNHRLDANVTIEPEASFPRASGLLPYVEQQWSLGKAQAAEMAQPVYLRNDVAKKKAEQGKALK